MSVALVACLRGGAARAEDDIDGRFTLRVGPGYSAVLDGPVIVSNLSDEIRLPKSNDWLAAHVLLGADFVTARPVRGALAGAPDRGYTSAELGGGLEFRAPKSTLLVASWSLGALFDSPGETTRFIGVGGTTRASVFFLYDSLTEVVACERGAGYAFLGSSLHFWTALRADAAYGALGWTVSAGFGVDLARAVIAPVVTGALGGGCFKKR